MNIAEVAEVVALVAVGDHRKVTDLDIHYWHSIIGDVNKQDALDAVRLHRKESHLYLTPAHVVAGARRLASERAWREGSRMALEQSKARHPKPKNLDAMSRAANDPVEWARQLGIYNQQLIEEGYPPLYEPVDEPVDGSEDGR